MVFYGGFLLLTLWYQYKEQWLSKNAFFFALPILFWALKVALGKPEVPYNAFVFLQDNFLSGFVKNFWNGIAYGFFWPLVAPIAILQRKIFAGLFAIMLVIIHTLTKRFLHDDNHEENAGASEKYWRYVMAGTFLFFLGLAPYLAIDKAPHIFGFGFSMRHALLLPLGSALVILGAILGAIQKKWQMSIQIIVVALFITFSVYNYFALDMDWHRQNAIVAAFANTQDNKIQEASTLIVYDNAGGTKYQNRTIGEFEYQVYVNEAFPKEHFKFVILGNGETNPQFLESHMFPAPLNFDPLAKPVSIEIISRATREIFTVQEWLTLKKYELFESRETFLQKLKDDFQIEIVPLS